jgi:hypothetical protein
VTALALTTLWKPRAFASNYMTALFLTGYMLMAVFCPVLPTAALSVSLIVLFSLLNTASVLK